MTYASWEPRYRVTTVAPGKLDLFVITLIDGKLATFDAVTEYESTLARARAFVRDRQCQVKVLPMTGPELRNLFGISLPERPRPMDAAVRQQITGTLLQVARDSNDPDARADALKLLADMGEVVS